MMFRSEHYRNAAAALGFRMTIDRSPGSPRPDGNAMLFRATGQDGTPVVLAIDRPVWRDLLDEFGADALDELESLALSGCWQEHRGARVWRVILI